MHIITVVSLKAFFWFVLRYICYAKHPEAFIGKFNILQTRIYSALYVWHVFNYLILSFIKLEVQTWYDTLLPKPFIVLTTFRNDVFRLELRTFFQWFTPKAVIIFRTISTAFMFTAEFTFVCWSALRLIWKQMRY